MKKLLLGTFLIVAFASFAVENDVTTKPNLYYLKSSEVVDSYKLLPPPPAVDSIGFLNDKEILLEEKLHMMMQNLKELDFQTLSQKHSDTLFHQKQHQKFIN